MFNFKFFFLFLLVIPVSVALSITSSEPADVIFSPGKQIIIVVSNAEPGNTIRSTAQADLKNILVEPSEQIANEKGTTKFLVTLPIDDPGKGLYNLLISFEEIPRRANTGSSVSIALAKKFNIIIPYETGYLDVQTEPLIYPANTPFKLNLISKNVGKTPLNSKVTATLNGEVIGPKSVNLNYLAEKIIPFQFSSNTPGIYPLNIVVEDETTYEKQALISVGQQDLEISDAFFDVDSNELTIDFQYLWNEPLVDAELKISLNGPSILKFDRKIMLLQPGLNTITASGIGRVYKGKYTAGIGLLVNGGLVSSSKQITIDADRDPPKQQGFSSAKTSKTTKSPSEFNETLPFSQRLAIVLIGFSIILILFAFYYKKK